MTGKCRKCGESLISPHYYNARDVLKYICSCGYSWAEDPLDKKIELEELNPTVLSKKNLKDGEITASRSTCPHGVMIGLCSTSFDPRGFTCKKCYPDKD